MKKGWISECTSYYGGYHGNFRVYEVTSPNGNIIDDIEQDNEHVFDF